MANKTKKDAVYRLIKKKIYSGYLMPGTRLVESDLATSHKVSRTIVREVIKQLALEGIVNLADYKGATVAKISIADLEEVYRIQQDLEGLAAYLATPRFSDAHILELEQIVSESQKYFQGDIAEWQRLNTKFHRMFLKNSGNRHLLSYVESNRDKFKRYWYLLLSIPGCIESLSNEHQEIIEGVKARNPELVRCLMEKHIEGATTRLLKVAKNIYHSSFTF